MMASELSHVEIVRALEAAVQQDAMNENYPVTILLLFTNWLLENDNNDNE
jgi:hypothetical protein